MRTSRRAKTQSGHEILEFGLVALMFTPLLLGSFVTGMNLIRSIQANHVVRDVADMYIHGADFSDKGMQAVAARLATGMGLQVGTGTGHAADNIGNGGRGIIWVSKVMWVGTTSEAQCLSVPANQVCNNTQKFVFLERIRFGNGTLESERPSSLGHPTGAVIDSYGRVTSSQTTDTTTQVPSPYQAPLQALWQVNDTALGRVPMADGQYAYVVEGYFKSPDLNVSSVQGRGVYARWFY